MHMFFFLLPKDTYIYNDITQEYLFLLISDLFQFQQVLTSDSKLSPLQTQL